MSFTDLLHKLLPLNTNQAPPLSFPFTFHVAPGTDLWRKPPSTFSASQPTFYIDTVLRDFESATVKIKKLPYVHLYDQAGVVFIWANNPEVWVKAGVEYYQEEPRRSSVAPGIGGWSDWSVAAPVKDNKDIVVLAERERNNGSALNIIVDGQIIREIQGVFTEDNLDEAVWVGFYGARPADVEGTLDVEIAGFDVKLKGH